MCIRDRYQRRVRGINTADMLEHQTTAHIENPDPDPSEDSGYSGSEDPSQDRAARAKHRRPRRLSAVQVDEILAYTSSEEELEEDPDEVAEFIARLECAQRVLREERAKQARLVEEARERLAFNVAERLRLAAAEEQGRRDRAEALARLHRESAATVESASPELPFVPLSCFSALKSGEGA
eukprot:TRINITY_DN3208_c0_g1_i1.p1 TRINITY_DN3208_c0_g1~~TRINITY_DN3208_c0_g1_i1.p1  ORF type:complete len:181 (+),score=48.89 TRINITY_DN3208_c0_g1_i1:100-642(+)